MDEIWIDNWIRYVGISPLGMVQNSLILGHQKSDLLTSSEVSERAIGRVSAAERASEASSAEKANE